MNKKLLTAAIASALAAPMAAQAIEFSVSGHVNRMIRIADDGDGADIQHLDNGASMSRFRMKGSGDLGNGMKVGTYLETAVASSVASKTALKAREGAATDTAFNIRHSALWFSGSWGKVTMGHTSEANDGTSTVDMSRTWMADSATSPGAVAGSVALRLNTANAGTSTGCGGTCTVGSFFTTFDGSRKDVLRYDSPAFGPAKIAASISNNEQWGIGLSVSQDMAGGSFALKAGYGDRDNQSGNSIWAISGGFKFSQGTSISLQYAADDKVAAGAVDGDRFYVKLAHDWGNNGVSLSYGEVNDAIANTDLTYWGVGFNHAFPKAGVDIYAGYHNFDIGLNATSQAAIGIGTAEFQDVDAFVVGTRIKFK